mgnify:CR=1 FL=1
MVACDMLLFYVHTVLIASLLASSSTTYPRKTCMFCYFGSQKNVILGRLSSQNLITIPKISSSFIVITPCVEKLLKHLSFRNYHYNLEHFHFQ